MSTQLYREGTTHDVNGINCEAKNFDGDVLHALDNGWFYSPEDAYDYTVEDIIKLEEEQEESKDDKETRNTAKDFGIKKYNKKSIAQLNKELDEITKE